jgi:Bacterial extracellular solute-binding protein, family 7
MPVRHRPSAHERRQALSTIADYKGLKMRIGTPLGGKVYVRAGGTSVLIPAAEIYAALERGVIDAAEWVGRRGTAPCSSRRAASRCACTRSCPDAERYGRRSLTRMPAPGAASGVMLSSAARVSIDA